MNTIRFFLLLVSIFFFAFLFQTDAFRSIRKKEEVLSKQTSSHVVIKKTPLKTVSTQQANILELQYPNSKLQLQTEAKEVFSTTDNMKNVIDWYSSRLHMTVPDGEYESEKDRSVLFTGYEKKKKIIVQISQREGSPVIFISISISAT